MDISEGFTEIIQARWPLLAVGLLILVGFAGLLWQRWRSGESWRREVTFYVDLIALAITGIVVGTIATSQLTAPPPETTPTPAPKQAVVVPTATASPTARPTLPPPPTATSTATPTATSTPPTTVTYVVKSGDTLRSIATEYNVSVEVIRQRNGLTSDILQIDQELIIPLPTPTPGPTNTPEPAQAEDDDDGSPAQSGPVIHTVKQGQTLGFIAQLYGVTVDDIAAANPDMNPDQISVGQEIVIPHQQLTPTPAPTDEPDEPTATPTATPVETPRGPIVHRVQQGETLRLIAQDYGVTTDEIEALNPNLDPDRLSIGQEILIPNQPVTPTPTASPTPDVTATPTSTNTPTPTHTPTPAPTIAPRGGEQEYTVQSGDTLRSIAQRFGVTVEAIQRRNGLTSDILQIDQMLIIPDPSAGVPTNTPEPTQPATATPFPTVTSTPLPAPQLLSPRDGTLFSGETTEIVLDWSWNGTLGENEWFDVQLWIDGNPPLGRDWTKQTEWQVPSRYYEQSSWRSWQWRVVVVRGVQGANRTEISPPSATRSFSWD